MLGRFLLLVSLFAPSLARAADRYQLGVDLAQSDGEIYVIGVLEESRAARAHLEPGQRLLAIDGEAVRTLADVARLVTAKGGERGVELQVAANPHAGIGWPDFRVGLRALFLPVSGQSDVISARFAGAFDLRLLGGLWIELGVGYIPLGREAFVSGRDLLAANLGLEYEQPFTSGLSGFARGVAGAQLPLDDQDFYEVRPISVGAELGGRFRFFEAFLSGGLGPARGFNFGVGVGFYFEIRPSLTVSRY